MSEFVSARYSTEDPQIATLVLARTPTNALTRQAYRELAAAAEEIAARPDIAVAVLYGGHEIFCAGDDLPELRTLNAEEARGFARIRTEAIEAVAAISKPTVAAITGYALGSGLTLALAADWRISGDNVKFGVTEILDGLAADAGGLTRLAAAIGAGRAKELAYSGRFFDAEEAHALGLIEQMVSPDGVYEAALGWARRFIGASPGALAAAKIAIDSQAVLSPAERADAGHRRYGELAARGFGVAAGAVGPVLDDSQIQH